MKTAPGEDLEPGTTIVHPGDGALMVYVPCGEFVMGLEQAGADRIARHLGFERGDDLWAWETYPRRNVYLEGFFIDKYEVTVERWQRFVGATGHRSSSSETSRHFDQPAAKLLPAGAMTWAEARQYARWAGKTLPTEAQWEKAARGTDGRAYPWGNSPPDESHGHFGQAPQQGGRLPSLYTLVGSFPKGSSPCGALDMLGNQYEWTSQWQTPYPGNPHADKMRSYHSSQNVCLRGGSWYHGWIGFYAAKRFGLPPEETHFHIGFRTVWKPPPDYTGTAAFARDRAAVSQRRDQLDQFRQAAVGARRP
jgi:formylglycine-generating enzyme required for sulfatase activity